MMAKHVVVFFTAVMFFICSSFTLRTPECDKICGKWMSAQKNLIVQVYKEGDSFRAKIVWFSDKDDPSRPMDVRTDYKNPDKALQDRKVIGMNVLDGLQYIPKTDSWENGEIYDAMSGHTWSSAAYIAPNGELKVTGYWHFKFIGRTLTFVRI